MIDGVLWLLFPISFGFFFLLINKKKKEWHWAYLNDTNETETHSKAWADVLFTFSIPTIFSWLFEFELHMIRVYCTWMEWMPYTLQLHTYATVNNK